MRGNVLNFGGTFTFLSFLMERECFLRVGMVRKCEHHLVIIVPREIISRLLIFAMLLWGILNIKLHYIHVTSNLGGLTRREC